MKRKLRNTATKLWIFVRFAKLFFLFCFVVFPSRCLACVPCVCTSNRSIVAFWMNFFFIYDSLNFQCSVIHNCKWFNWFYSFCFRLETNSNYFSLAFLYLLLEVFFFVRFLFSPVVWFDLICFSVWQRELVPFFFCLIIW